jgi:4-hydroxy-3-polyprenylbenzoate decarboxylase
VTAPAARIPWIVGVSGASGSPYARSVVNALLDADVPVDLIVSRSARLTVVDETGLGIRDGRWAEDVSAWLGRDVDEPEVVYWRPNDFAAGPSSGTYRAHGMIVVPATVAAVAGIAIGLSKDLLQRAGTVTLKERRPLVVVPREAPYPRSLLVQMLDLHDQGAVIVPASPGFYAGATSVDQLVDFVAAKILDAAGVEHTLIERWSGA